MKKYYYFALAGSILLVISAIIPLGYVNDKSVTIIPAFGNMVTDNDIWIWKDISAFAFTYVVTSILTLIFSVKKMKIGTMITVSLVLFSALFILVSLWFASFNAENFKNTSFSVSIIDWVLVFAGIAAVYFGAAYFDRLTTKTEEARA